MALILIVDDDKLVRESLSSALEGAGYQVVTATDGNEALATLQREACDLVLLDIMMPVRDGIETLRDIRRSWPRLPVLMISAGDRWGWTEVLRLSADLGATDTLAKPFTASKLLERVSRLLAQTT